ncbi:MAG: 1-phosphofructokinase family hexose kinase [Phycisphaeraceae bacterium]
MDARTSIVTVTLNTAVDRVLEVENFAIGGHLRAREVARYPAGKGINVSRSLARLGVDNIATGFTGQPEAGQFEQLLAGAGPGRAVDQLLTARGRTRENITILDPVEHTDTHVRTSGYEVTRRDLQRIVSKLGLLTREGAIVTFSGSLPPGMNPVDLDTLLYVVLGGGGRVVADLSGDLLKQCTSIDLEISGELDRSERYTGPKMLWMVKPNRNELAEALGIDRKLTEQEVLAAGRRLAERVTWVVITLGADGALLFGEEGTWRARCEIPPEDVVSTVGCGDSLLAGLLEAQLHGGEPPQMLKRGVATATANAVHTGIADFTLDLVRELESQTVVDSV